MLDVDKQLYNNERLKDLYRDADQARLARSIKHKPSSLASIVRKSVGQGLIGIGRRIADSGEI